MEDKFKFIIETRHVADRGESENVICYVLFKE